MGKQPQSPLGALTENASASTVPLHLQKFQGRKPLRCAPPRPSSASEEDVAQALRAERWCTTYLHHHSLGRGSLVKQRPSASQDPATRPLSSSALRPSDYALVPWPPLGTSRSPLGTAGLPAPREASQSVPALPSAAGAVAGSTAPPTLGALPSEPAPASSKPSKSVGSAGSASGHAEGDEVLASEGGSGAEPLRPPKPPPAGTRQVWKEPYKNPKFEHLRALKKKQTAILEAVPMKNFNENMLMKPVKRTAAAQGATATMTKAGTRLPRTKAAALREQQMRDNQEVAASEEAKKMKTDKFLESWTSSRRKPGEMPDDLDAPEGSEEVRVNDLPGPMPPMPAAEDPGSQVPSAQAKAEAEERKNKAEEIERKMRITAMENKVFDGAEADLRFNVMEKMKEFDVNGDGEIDFKEFQRACVTFGKAGSKTKFQKLFDQMDADKSGKIDLAEFVTSDLMHWGSKAAPKHVESNMFKQEMEHVNTGHARTYGTRMDREDAARAAVANMKQKKTASAEMALQLARAKLKGHSHAAGQQIFKAFNFFDSDGSGKLSYAEVAGALETLKVPIQKDVLGKLLRTFDVDGDGHVDYREFVREFNPTAGGGGIYKSITTSII